MCAESVRQTSETSLKKIRFREFTYDPASEELRRGDDVVPIRPGALRALRLLVSRAGQIVSHDDLRNAVWGQTVVEWRDGLHQIVRELRKVLGDESQNPLFIETHHRRGYRFCASVEPVAARARSGRTRPAGKAHELLLFGAGAISIPLLIALVCVAMGLSG